MSELHTDSSGGQGPTWNAGAEAAALDPAFSSGGERRNVNVVSMNE